MKIKTYPLQFTEEYLKHIEEVVKEDAKAIWDINGNMQMKNCKNEIGVV